MIMLLCHRFGAVSVALLASLLTPLAGAAVQRSENVNAALMEAEIALERGDCRVASQNYLTAAQQVSDLDLVERASDVALDCGQYAAAEAVAVRWQTLARNDSSARMAGVRAQLGRCRINDARANFEAWLGDANPGDDEVLAAIELLADRSGVDVTLAMLREVRNPRLATVAVQQRLAALALDGWDFALALKYAAAANRAGRSDPESASAGLKALTARAYAGLGETKAALADARTAAAAGGDQSLAMVETLIWLGRDSEAEQELLKLREQPTLQVRADRRLALLELSRSEYRQAERRLTALLRDQQSAALAVFYLGTIAERRGDAETAVRSYELLVNTGFDGAARRRIAGIYYRDGDQRQAIRLLAPGDRASIVERIASELQIADLLASEAAPKEGVARLDTALQNYPTHPEIGYQRAVLLERFDANAAIAALEELARQRPADMNVANALGFTLADHKRELPRAEKLIRAALQAQPDNPAVLDSMGWVLAQRGQDAAALPYLQRAFRLFHDGDIGAHLGELLWRLNRRDEARNIWTQAFAADPDSRLLADTTRRYAPEMAAPKPPPRLSPGEETAI